MSRASLALLLCLFPAWALGQAAPAVDADTKAARLAAERLWERIGAGDSAGFLSQFARTEFVDYATKGIPLPPEQMAGFRRGFTRSLDPNMKLLGDSLATTWKNSTFEVLPAGVVKDKAPASLPADVIVRIAAFEPKDEAFNLIDFLMRKTPTGWKWLDLRDTLQGTWMRTRMVGTLSLLVAGRIKLPDLHTSRAYGNAVRTGQWAQAKAAFGRMPEALRFHRAILPTARMAANNLVDKEWAKSLRAEYVKRLGIDDSLRFNDVDYYAVLGEPKKAYEALAGLAKDQKSSGLLWYKSSMVALSAELWESALADAKKSVAITPDFHGGYVGIVAAHAGAKRYADAVAAIKATAAKFPTLEFDWTIEDLFGDLARSAEYKAAFGQ